MARLLDDLGDLWEIVLDLLTFYHECCYNCQPRDDGDFVWLSEEHDIQDVLQEFVEGVCNANDVPVPTYLDSDAVAEAIDESPTT